MPSPSTVCTKPADKVGVTFRGGATAARTRLCDPAATQGEGMPVEMLDVALETEEGLGQADGFAPVEVGVLACEAAGLGLGADADDDVAGGPLGRLVGLALKDNLAALGEASVDVEVKLGGRLDDAVATTDRAEVGRHPTAAAALVAVDLHLGEHAGGELLPDDLDAGAAAAAALDDVRRFPRAAALARLADRFALHGELCNVGQSGAVSEGACQSPGPWCQCRWRRGRPRCR